MMPLHGHFPERPLDARTYTNLMFVMQRVEASGPDRALWAAHYSKLAMAITDAMPPEFRELVHHYGDRAIPLYLLGYPAKAVRLEMWRTIGSPIVRVDKRR